jgi:hypothetical protein
MKCASPAQGIIIKAAVERGHTEAKLGKIEYSVLFFGPGWKCTLMLIKALVGRCEVLQAAAISGLVRNPVEA